MSSAGQNYPTNPTGKRTVNSEFIAADERYKFFRMRPVGFQSFYTAQVDEEKLHPLNLAKSLKSLADLVGNLGGVIAGGAVAFALLDEFDKAGDIDIFAPSHDDFKKILNTLEQAGFVQDVTMPWFADIGSNWQRVPFMLYNPGLNSLGITKKIQVCKLVYYRNATAVINSFDLTCAQFAYDGVELVTGRTAIDDLTNRRLNAWNVHDLASFAKRLEKYEARGFSIGDGREVIDFPRKKEQKVSLRAVADVDPNDPWQNPEYRRDYSTMDPRDFQRKWGSAGA